MNREQTTFVINGQNNLLKAINNAKDFCQRAVDFEYAKEQVVVKNVSLLNGASLSDAVLFRDNTMQVKVKTAKRAYLPVNGTGISGQVPVDMISRQAWASRQQRRLGSLSSLRAQEVNQQLTATSYCIVRDGLNFYIQPGSAQAFGGLTLVNVYFDVIRWIDDYITHGPANANVHGDFLLQYCYDYLLYRSVYELNFFLKEDQRVPLSKDLLDETWNNVIQWNATLVDSSVEDVSLD